MGEEGAQVEPRMLGSGVRTVAGPDRHQDHHGQSDHQCQTESADEEQDAGDQRGFP